MLGQRLDRWTNFTIGLLFVSTKWPCLDFDLTLAIENQVALNLRTVNIYTTVRCAYHWRYFNDYYLSLLRFLGCDGDAPNNEHWRLVCVLDDIHTKKKQNVRNKLSLGHFSEFARPGAHTFVQPVIGVRTCTLGNMLPQDVR